MVSYKQQGATAPQGVYVEAKEISDGVQRLGDSSPNTYATGLKNIYMPYWDKRPLILGDLDSSVRSVREQWTGYRRT